jgi:hypothetical protein
MLYVDFGVETPVILLIVLEVIWKSKVTSLLHMKVQDGGAQGQSRVGCQVGAAVVDCEVPTERLRYRPASEDRNYITK